MFITHHSLPLHNHTYLHSQPFIVCDDMFHVLSRELDPAPNPPSFSSNIIKATLDYLSKCHSASHKSLVAILSKTLRILLAVCQKASEMINAYERHHPADVPHVCQSAAQGGQGRPGGAWAFIL
uniref:Uncharacterized protein n=1 Tax=Salmo trutta TaxID=8032 RepID=A0A674D9M8_SALTR